MTTPPLPQGQEQEQDFASTFAYLEPSQQRALAADVGLSDALALRMNKWMLDWTAGERVTMWEYLAFAKVLVANPALSVDTTTFVAAQALDRMPRQPDKDRLPVAEFLHAWSTNFAVPLAELIGELDQTSHLGSLFDRTVQALWFSFRERLVGTMYMRRPTKAQEARFWPMVEEVTVAAERQRIDTSMLRDLTPRVRLNGEAPREAHLQWRAFDNALSSVFRPAFRRPKPVAIEASSLVWFGSMALLHDPRTFAKRAAVPEFWAIVRPRSSYPGPPWFWQVALKPSRRQR